MEDGRVGISERNGQIKTQSDITGNKDKIGGNQEATTKENMERGTLSTELSSKKRPFLTPFWANVLYIVLILALLSFMIFLVWWMLGEGKECLAQPIDYYAKKTAQNCVCWRNMSWR